MSDIGENRTPTGPYVSSPPWPAPPTQPGSPPSPKPPRWPKILGTVSLIYACLGLCGSIVGVVILIIPVEPLTATTQPGEPTFREGYQVGMIGIHVIALVLEALLIGAAIGLFQRAPWARRLCLLWAWAYLIITLAWTVITISYQEVFMPPASPTGGPMDAKTQRLIMIFSLAMGTVWAAALPVFMMVWLNRPKIRQETAAWC